jgi:integrase
MMKRRPNGKGNVVFITANREKPWVARITLGQDDEGKQIRHNLGQFHTELDALIFLEEFHKKPTPIYIKQAKYDRISTPSNFGYSLIPVENPKLEKYKMVQKERYTFAQVYEDFAKQKILTKEEMKEAKERNIKVKGKLSTSVSRQYTSCYRYTEKLQKRIYRDLTAKDFQNLINEINLNSKGSGITLCLIKLFRNMDKYALQEGIIEKGYAQFLNNDTAKSSKMIKNVFTYDEIYKLENMKTSREKEELIKDIFLIALYTGCRISEILYLKNENIHLEKGYFIGGVKTKAGIDRQIPIHHKIKSIIQKYYNANNEFLIDKDGKAYSYDLFSHALRPIKKKYDFFKAHSIHECRHTFRTELEQMNVKQVIINAILGHSNGDVGLDTYTHITLEEKKMAVNMIDYSKKNNLVVLKTS